VSDWGSSDPSLCGKEGRFARTSAEQVNFNTRTAFCSRGAVEWRGSALRCWGRCCSVFLLSCSQCCRPPATPVTDCSKDRSVFNLPHPIISSQSI
ncbi:unnamed protein product, partial [Closterium sp. Yama58-4]